MSTLSLGVMSGGIGGIVSRGGGVATRRRTSASGTGTGGRTTRAGAAHGLSPVTGLAEGAKVRYGPGSPLATERGGGTRGASIVAAAAAAGDGEAVSDGGEAAAGGGGAVPGTGPTINLPTAITLVRVVAVPVVTALFYAPGAWVSPTCCFIFVMAAATDWLDGYLARRMNLVSSFGAFLDPVADKLMVAAALILLCTVAPRGVPAWAVAVPATIIIGREITMSAIREWAAAAGGEAHSAVAVNSYGKWKTATQLVALSILLGVRDGAAWLGLDPVGAAAGWLTQGGVVCLWASAALALLSLWIYMVGVFKYMD